jgi:vancomycin resistance protein VanJ
VNAPVPARRQWPGWAIAVLAAITATLILGHRYIPNSPGNVGSFLETFLPWLGLPVPFLLAAAALARSKTGAIAAGLAAVVWLGTFGQLLVPGKGGGEHSLRVVTHNVGVSNPDNDGTAKALLETGADLIALQELSSTGRKTYAAALARDYPYSVTRGTVALWSKLPVSGQSSVDIGMGWTRALRAQVQTPAGPLAVYVAHLASVRVDTDGFSSQQRNNTIAELGQGIGAEKLAKVLVMGDFNGSAYDRELAPLTFGLSSAQAEAGFGFGFTWPAQFPLARIDHVLVKGVTVTDARVLPRTGSDHRPVEADLRL